ncbi:DinB family protein [Streptomyces albiaxialis]|uniref:DinB family protein n=1 Tax=Streptomyces albiaxialis TaxID=329523 RepID=A0ABP5H316_9ACTN
MNDVSRTALLRWQFDMTWSLFEYHAERLEEADHLWEPAEVCWTVRKGADGLWRPDFAEVEPEPVPVPTIAWVTWHMGWWWSTALAHLRGRTPPERTEVTWPGDGASALAWLRGLREEWLAALDTLPDPALDAPAPFPWHNDPDHTLAHTLAWANAELMKNATELGHVRMLRAASGR